MGKTNFDKKDTIIWQKAQSDWYLSEHRAMFATGIQAEQSKQSFTIVSYCSPNSNTPPGFR